MSSSCAARSVPRRTTIHVTRWERLEDWEAMSTDQAFLDLLTETDPEFEPTTAEV